jgi:glycosyltransferase involved in cell wall biosynthesis
MLLTSRYEGMPNVILEAMASGLPVVATRVEGVVELLGAGVKEQTVSFGDTPEFLDRVRAFTDSPEWRKQWGTNNLRRAAEEVCRIPLTPSHSMRYWPGRFRVK